MSSTLVEFYFNITTASNALSAVGCVSYFAHISYSLLKEKKPLIGYRILVIFLTISVFFRELGLLISAFPGNLIHTSKTACLVQAVGNYYFSAAVYFWNAVIAVYFYFFVVVSKPGSDDRSPVIWCALLGTILPLIMAIVGAALGAYNSEAPSSLLWCWVNPEYGQWGFFVPTLLPIVVTFVALGMTIFQIRKIQRKSGTLQVANQTKRFVTFLKLFSLFGFSILFSWVVRVYYTIYPTAVNLNLNTTNSVFLHTQGVWIAIAGGPCGRLYGLWKRKFVKKETRRQQRKSKDTILWARATPPRRIPPGSSSAGGASFGREPLLHHGEELSTFRGTTAPISPV